MNPRLLSAILPMFVGALSVTGRTRWHNSRAAEFEDRLSKGAARMEAAQKRRDRRNETRARNDLRRRAGIALAKVLINLQVFEKTCSANVAKQAFGRIDRIETFPALGEIRQGDMGEYVDGMVRTVRARVEFSQELSRAPLTIKECRILVNGEEISDVNET